MHPCSPFLATACNWHVPPLQSAPGRGLTGMAFLSAPGAPPLLATCTRDGAVAVWEPRSGHRLALMRGHMVGVGVGVGVVWVWGPAAPRGGRGRRCGGPLPQLAGTLVPEVYHRSADGPL